MIKHFPIGNAFLFCDRIVDYIFILIIVALSVRSFLQYYEAQTL